MSGRGLAVLVLLLVAPGRANAQLVGAVAPIVVDGCDERPIDTAALAERVDLEAFHEQSPGVSVRVVCDGADARVIVLDRGVVRVERRADLGDAEGTARTWALAIVIADLLRRPFAPSAGIGAELTGPRSLDSLATRDPTLTVARLAGSASSAPSASTGAAETTTSSRPHHRTSLLLGARVHLAFELPTGVLGGLVGLRHEWFRLALTIGATHRGHELGAITAGVGLIDVAVLPLVLGESDWTLAAEVFAHGGALYGSGQAISPSVRASSTLAGVLGCGLGARLGLGADAVALEVGLRLGYDVLGADLKAGETTLLRVHGFFGALEIAIAFGIGSP